MKNQFKYIIHLIIFLIFIANNLCLSQDSFFRPNIQSNSLTVDGTNISNPSVRLSVDTVLIYGTAIGAGIPSDTALFRQGYKYASLNEDGTDTLVITKIKGTVQGTSPDVDVKFYYDVNEFDATPTAVNTTALTITSTTTGNSTTTINNPKIPPGYFLWPELTETTVQPIRLGLWVYGYRIKKR